MQISAKYHIKLFNVTASRYWVGLEVQLAKLKDVVNIFVDNCKFIENIKDIYIYLRESNRIQLILKNTIFVSALTTESGYAIRIVIPSLRGPLLSPEYPSIWITTLSIPNLLQVSLFSSKERKM